MSARWQIHAWEVNLSHIGVNLSPWEVKLSIARWQIYAVLICSIYVRSRIERLCNALEATRLSAYVRSGIEI